MSRLRTSAWKGSASAILVATLAAVAPLATPAQSVPIEDFVRPPEFESIRFSPDGKRFAAIVDNKGRAVLTVVDFATSKGKSYAHDRGLDVDSFRWLTNDLITVRSTRTGVRAFDLEWGDFVNSFISVDGKSGPAWTFVDSAIRRLPGSETEVVVGIPNGYNGTDLLVVDSTNGDRKRYIMDKPPGPRIRSWILDEQVVARAGIGFNSTTREREIWARDSADAPWVKVLAYNPRTERGFVPVAVDANGDLLVLSNQATGRDALYRLDRATRKPGELLAGHAEFDIDESDLYYAARTRVPIGVEIDAERPQTYWFDTTMASYQRTLDASLPAGRVNKLTRLENGKILVRSHSDTEPGAYYFFDPQAKTLTEWLRTRPWIRPEQMSKMEVLRYRARDGQELFGYFTRPAAAPPGKPVPLLVWVHGGPTGRDYWGFDADVQFFASRGYAVFQPNFRGSTGMGDEFEKAGFRQWGRLMQDDVTDGVRALIDQNKVDPRRICIGGASYGGYAALMGVIREPEMFRCAIDEVGVTDLIDFVDSPVPDYNRRTSTPMDADMERDLYRRVGDTRDPRQRKAMEENSPRRQASKIKVPVLLLYGTSDWRVPLEHGTSIRDALRTAGARYEWKSYDGEGHGIWDRQNQRDRLQRLEKFLAENLGTATNTPN